MTRTEAIQAMKDGKHVTHIYFSEGEWATMENHFGDWGIITEDGHGELESDFWKYRRGWGWEDNWSIHWTSNTDHIDITNINEVLLAGHKITHDGLKYDWIELADNGNIRCSSGEERTPIKFWNQVLKLETFETDWKIVEYEKNK